MTDKPASLMRRRLVRNSALAAGATALPILMGAPASARAPAIISPNSVRPSLPYGLQFGDPRLNAALAGGRPASADVIAWTKADRLSRLRVEWALSEQFVASTRLPSLLLHPADDYTGRIDLTGLPPGQRIFVRMIAHDLDTDRAMSEPVIGSFVTPHARDQDLRFVWGGDTAGQGWGISPNQGGMLTYATMLAQRPAFFVHSGDTIYADNPLDSSKAMPNGDVWQNLVTEDKSKVAESLDEFRGNYQYNMMDEYVRAFNQEVPQIWQWDDHEVVNNWSDSKDLSEDDRYNEKSVPTLIARGSKAFLEYAPMRNFGDGERDRVYRHTPYGPMLDLYSIDMRSYRGANSDNLQPSYDESAHLLGPIQLEWLKDSLLASAATWKVICSDMPIGLQVGDGQNADGSARWEAVANADPNQPLGREQEIANLLSFIKHNAISNVVWITADVHYCAAHYYSPERATFQDFNPFWEFVAGPLHAGAFGPGKLDSTFGIEPVFFKAPSAPNLPPADDTQFFGQVDLDAASKAMTVSLIDRGGSVVFSRQLAPA